MKLQNLKYFEKLVDLKNYSSVAQFYNVGQPTVSMAIKRLEEDIGYDLIVKDNKYNQFSLTPKGERFHHYSKKVVAELKRLEEEIKFQNSQIKVKIGLPPMINNTYFPKIATRLDQSTLFNIESTVNSSSILLKKLRNQEIDLAIISSMKPVKLENAHLELLATDEFKVAINKNNPLSNKKRVTFNDIENQNIILMNDEYIQAKIFKNIKKQRFSNPNVVYQTKYPEMIKKLVHDNLGISFLLSDFVKPEDNIVMVDGPEVEDKLIYISLVFRSNYHLSKYEKDLVKNIKLEINND